MKTHDEVIYSADGTVWEATGQLGPQGTPIYKPREIEGCGGCENGECCGVDLGIPCCGQGEFGPCEDHT